MDHTSRLCHIIYSSYWLTGVSGFAMTDIMLGHMAQPHSMLADLFLVPSLGLLLCCLYLVQDIRQALNTAILFLLMQLPALSLLAEDAGARFPLPLLFMAVQYLVSLILTLYAWLPDRCRLLRFPSRLRSFAVWLPLVCLAVMIWRLRL